MGGVGTSIEKARHVGPGRASFGSLRYITVRGGHAAMRSATRRMSRGSSVSKNSNASAVTRENIGVVIEVARAAEQLLE